MKVRTGEGNDRLWLDELAIHRKTKIWMGEGDDELAVRDSIFGGDAFADGGPGDDRLRLFGGNTFVAGKKAKSF